MHCGEHDAIRLIGAAQFIAAGLSISFWSDVDWKHGLENPLGSHDRAIYPVLQGILI